MSNALIPVSGRIPADLNPALVYIGSLPAQRSRETMLDALDIIAGMVSQGQETAEMAKTNARAWRRGAAGEGKGLMAEQPTGMALNRAIAEALGWRVEVRKLSHSGDMDWLVLVRPDGTVFETPDSYLPRFRPTNPFAENALWDHAPDWEHDAGAAYLLCLDCLDKLNVLENNQWYMEIGLGSVSFSRWCGNGPYISDSLGVDGRNAEALANLARLALEAIKAQAERKS